LILYFDFGKVEPDDLNLIQRFILALFHFETHKYGRWLSCDAERAFENGTCPFFQLTDVYPHSYISVQSYAWLSGINECEWGKSTHYSLERLTEYTLAYLSLDYLSFSAGIECDDFGSVTTIELKGQQINGTLPVELAELSTLRTLSLSWNELRGTIPEEYGKLNYLSTLDLHFNFLTGTFPTLKGAKSLRTLNLGENELTGTIPSSIK